jgi:hypothetical protein
MKIAKLINQAIGGGVLLISLSIASQAQASSFTYNGHQYSLTKIDSWTGAQSQAVAKGGNLVTINDAAEESWLISTFGNDLFWIGFNDVATEGTFEWVSGEPVTYTNWASDEPNDYTYFGNYFAGEDYTVMNWLGQQQWNDLGNTDYYWSSIRGIVEKPVPEPLTMLGAGTALGFGGLFKRKLAKDKKSNKA